ncbi:putative F-box protein At1g46984 [Lolium perenne]|uniref:putative F-box protein At1g46984 n=1 Tax=Lolium perenne TaxID=4522 RepID=UPI0021F50665|nr:putative F-box protein At1g46984 [Lolium perenne]
MDDEEVGCWEFPTDVLVEILQRLPPSSRRRSRLVCRHWRDAVDERTTEMRSHAKALLWNAEHSVAYVVDDLSPSSTGSCTELWRRPDSGYRGTYSGLQPVATCNGLLCLCDNTKRPGGAITLVNPATGEALPVPPLPLPCDGLLDESNWWVYRHWNRAYTFAYHPISGKYKVVHVPSSFRNRCKFDSVQVLTLGEASWREVPASPDAMCQLLAGVISVDGTTYWTTDGSAARVVSFDLEQERVTSFRLPPRPKRASYYPLTAVHGRLGIVVGQGDVLLTTVVWVLDKRRRWSRWYTLRQQQIPHPHFVYGNYVLTQEDSLYAHYTRKKKPSLSSGVVRVNPHQHHKVTNKTFGYAYYPSGTFAYVDTTEPLSVYATN